MKQETSLELLKLATQLACATINQNNYHTDTRKSGVEAVLKDCVKVILAQHQELLDNAK